MQTCACYVNVMRMGCEWDANVCMLRECDVMNVRLSVRLFVCSLCILRREIIAYPGCILYPPPFLQAEKHRKALKQDLRFLARLIALLGDSDTPVGTRGNAALLLSKLATKAQARRCV